MRLLTRYIVKETVIPFGLGLAVFTLLLLIARILKLVELVVNRGVPFLEVAKVFSYILPTFLEVTVPMALLLAILVALSRLSSDSEIVALKAAGVSLSQIAWPVGLFATCIYVLALGLSVYARPWGNRLLRNGLYEIAKMRATAGIIPKVFNDDFTGLLIYVDRIDPPGNVLHGVLISDTRESSKRDNRSTSRERSIPKTTIIARTGLLVPDESSQALTLRLTKGSLHAFDRARKSYHRTDFGTYDITLDLGAVVAPVARERDVSEMSLDELRTTIDFPSQPEEVRNVASAEFQRRFSIPFACLAFAAVAIPLGLRPSNSVLSRSLIVSLALILTYYLSLTLGQSLAERGVMPTIPALWLPNVCLLMVAAGLMRRSAKEPAVGTQGGFERWARWARTRLMRHSVSAGRSR